jgi:anti-anti-sigma factor
VTIGVGATLDRFAGRAMDAPPWMRRSGLEWVFRFAQSPWQRTRRWAEHAICFLPTVLGQGWRLAVGREAPARPQELSFHVADWLSVDAGARLTRRSLEEDAAFWKTLPERPAHCLVDVSKVRRVDGTGVAFLIRWRKQLLARSRQLVLLAPSRALRRTLAALQLADHFVIANDIAHAVRHAESLGAPGSAQRDGPTRSLAWCGEIIAANSDDVWRMTTDHVAAFVANRATLVIIDLSRLRFIDSAGAALMLRLKKWAQELHAEIIFAHPQPNVRNVLQLTRVDQLLLEGGQ